MDVIKSVYDFITGLGPSVMMPIIITLLALVLGAKFGRALRAGITVGIGFIGINLIIGLLFQYLGPAAEGMVKNWGVTLNAIDVGWPVAAAIAFGTQIGSIIFVVGLLVNIIMLVLRLTKTVDVDLWNYWHWAYTGSLIFVATGIFWLGILGSVLHAAFTLVVADRTAPVIQKYFNWPDLSIAHGWATASMLIVWPMMKFFDLIGLEKSAEAAQKSDLERLRERIGVFGEPVLIGLILGLIVGLLAYVPAGLAFGDLLSKLLQLAMGMAAVMLLMPRVVAILMEGLVPLSEQAREFLQKRFAGREFYIGMDSALMIGEPLTLTVAFLLVPITLLLAVILPGNRMLPFGDLAATPFFVVMATPFMRGRFWRTLITGIVIMIVIMYMGSIWTPLITATAQSIGYAFPEGATQISGFGNPFGWVLVMLSQLFFGK
ncbi:MAG TPA: PTS transporter subunit IIC [Anaerolineales bacterium]|nr:PTS transporter subunit IIC [Anaerolineales bacterium]